MSVTVSGDVRQRTRGAALPEDHTISAEAHVESIAVLRDAHRYHESARRRAIAEANMHRSWAERIDRAIGEVTAGQHAAERLIIRLRERRTVRRLAS